MAEPLYHKKQGNRVADYDKGSGKERKEPLAQSSLEDEKEEEQENQGSLKSIFSAEKSNIPLSHNVFLQYNSFYFLRASL